jgi:membrane protein YqaA with SNARE-associated domain
MIKKLYDWLGTQVNSRYALSFLAILSFLESILCPPVAPVLILFCIENKRKAFWYATITTVFSVLGGIVSYYIGFGLWHVIGQKIISYTTTPEMFEHLVSQYQKYETWAVLVGSFAPVPYKALAITAGFCNLKILPFIFYSLIGRGARYYLVAIALSLWGDQIKLCIDRWFNHLLFLFLLLTTGGFYLLLK